MRILYFNYLYDIRGASLGSAIKPIELFRELNKMGHTVKIHWFKDQPEQASKAGSSKKKIRQALKRIFAPAVHDLKLLWENIPFRKIEQRLVEEHKPDLIVARLDLYLFSAILTARHNRLPIIIEADSPPVYEAVTFQKRYWRLAFIPNWLERWVLRNADYIITQSSELQRYLKDRHGLDPRRMAMVTNGADVTKFTVLNGQTLFRERFESNEGPVLGFIGSLSVWHGVEQLIEIMRRVLTINPRVCFLICGSGGRGKAALETFVMENRLEKNVLLTGYVPYEDIPRAVQAMDIVLAPYPQMPFFYYSPVKLFEYMAAGKPVVTTKIGQIAEVVRHGENGFLADPNDLDGMITAILFLIENPAERDRIGRAARKTILHHHTWKHKAIEWERICNHVLMEKKAMRIAQVNAV